MSDYNNSSLIGEPRIYGLRDEKLVLSVAGTVAPATTDSGKGFINTAAATINIPSGCDINSNFTFEVGHASYFTINLPSGETWRYLANTIVSGGSLRCSTVGSKVTIKKTSANEWFVENPVGPWERDTTDTLGSTLGYTQTGAPTAFAMSSYLEVAHPPITDESKVRFACIGQVTGRTSQYHHTSASTASDWALEDLNINTATWIQDTAAKGHFSAAVSGKVQVGCSMWVGGAEYKISGFTGGGTNPSEVTIYGSAPISSAIESISGVRISYGSYIELTDGGGGIRPLNTYYYAITTGDKMIPQWLIGDINYLSMSGSFSTGSDIKAVISLDGGVTWLYYKNSSATWTAMTLDNFASQGCLVDSSTSRWLDDTGTAISSAALTTLAGMISSSSDIRFAYAIQSTSTYNTSIIYSVYIYYDEPDTWQPLAIGCTNTSNIDVIIRRISPTVTLFNNASYSASYANAICTVYI